jgi:hypothetical protein
VSGIRHAVHLAQPRPGLYHTACTAHALYSDRHAQVHVHSMFQCWHLSRQIAALGIHFMVLTNDASVDFYVLDHVRLCSDTLDGVAYMLYSQLCCSMVTHSSQCWCLR